MPRIRLAGICRPFPKGSEGALGFRVSPLTPVATLYGSVGRGDELRLELPPNCELGDVDVVLVGSTIVVLRASVALIGVKADGRSIEPAEAGNRLLDLKRRRLEPELMDDPSLDKFEHRRALAGLARVHQITFTISRIWNRIRSCLQDRDRASPISILDVGCGDGYLLSQIHRRALRSGFPVRLIGCDFSPTALELAHAKAVRADVAIELLHCDVLLDPLPTQADFVINSLFLHHFDDAQVTGILGEFDRAASRQIIIEDLARSTLGYGLCWLGTRTLSRSKIVHVDGLRSVKAAFRIEEMRQLLDEAGLQHARIESRFPERLLITWSPKERTLHA